MPNLNERIKDYELDKNLAVDIAVEINKIYTQRNFFTRLAGVGKSRCVKFFPIESGDGTFRYRGKDKLYGRGVRGNTDFATNYDEMNLLTMDIKKENLGIALKSELRASQKAKKIDFIRECKDSLPDWFNDRTDEICFASLINNFTNVVVCDKTTGYKENGKTITSPQKAVQKIAKGDKVTLKALRQLVYMAKNGVDYKGNKTGMMIPPLYIEKKNENGIVEWFDYVYLILLSSTQAMQLKQDPEWIKREQVNVRGKENGLFSGYLGRVDNAVVLEVPDWTDLQVGLPNTSVTNESIFLESIYSPKNGVRTTFDEVRSGADVVFGCLLGADAIAFGAEAKPQFYIGEADLGRKMVVGADMWVAIAKVNYTLNAPRGFDDKSIRALDGQDTGVIVLASSAE